MAALPTWLEPALLSVATASSLAGFAFLHTSPKTEGYVALPLNTSDTPSQTSEEYKHDPFDLRDGLAYVDGTPIDPEGFWAGLRPRKLLVLLASLLLFGLSLIPIVFQSFPLIDHSHFISPASNFNPSLLEKLPLVALYAFTSILAWRSLQIEDDVPRHWRLTLHMAGLLGAALMMRGVEFILPDRLEVEQRQEDGDGMAGMILGWSPVAEIVILTLVTSLVLSTPRGPGLYFPPDEIYTNIDPEAEKPTPQTVNTSGGNSGSIFSQNLFSHAGLVIKACNTLSTISILNLPILPAHLRALPLFHQMRKIYGTTQKSRSRPQGNGWTVFRRVYQANSGMFLFQASLAIVTAALYYAPAYFIQQLVQYIEDDPNREHPRIGYTYALGLFSLSAANYILTNILWAVTNTILQTRIKVQLNTLLFAKTLVRKDVASSPKKASLAAGETAGKEEKKDEEDDDEEDVNSRSQVMTLMTVDVDRVADFVYHTMSLIDSPVEVVVGSILLYHLMGSSALIGLAAVLVFFPIQHFSEKAVVTAQDGLMKARDERTALMNEVLNGIRMLKFMAWERPFEKRIHTIRAKELGWQKRDYIIQIGFGVLWSVTPIVVTLVAFLHYVYYRGLPLTPSLAFTSVAIFGELRFALNALPETFISIITGFVSLRRIEKYLATAEVEPVSPSTDQRIYFNNATITWPRDRVSSGTESAASGAGGASSTATTPKSSFVLRDLTICFPEGELSLVCGRLGSGKTLLLLALLGEADLLTGQLICPRSASDAMSTFSLASDAKDWVVPSLMAYVPQSAWLQNDSIKQNVLFGLPYNHKRYVETLAACSLTTDLEILEDGDQTEIGERGLNLSGGQKARVSLARAVYSRASTLLLDDVLSAVDAHTAHHLFHHCLKGPLLKGRTIILVSHHVTLAAPGAAYVVALDNGALEYAGDREGFLAAGVLKDLVEEDPDKAKSPVVVDDLITIEDTAAPKIDPTPSSQASLSTTIASIPTPEITTDASALEKKPKAPRKLVEDEKRAIGRVDRSVWTTYFRANGGILYWTIFNIAFVVSAFTPVFENGWLRVWSSSYSQDPPKHEALYYLGIYAFITLFGVFLGALREMVLFYGSLNASERIHHNMLERVLFATVRFHETTNRGRLLNRFGKDLEGIDSSVANSLGQTVINVFNLVATITSISLVGGWPFACALCVLGALYFKTGSVYSSASRDMRRLDSTTRSPLYSLYSETIAGVSVVRAFGASANTLRQMMRCVDTNLAAYYWYESLNRWLSARFNLLSSALLGATGFVVVSSPSISAPTAGFALAFALSIAGTMLMVVRRFTSLEQSMVAVERIKEYSVLNPEGAEFVEPRPAASWPSEGKIVVEDLVIRYAPDLPNVLHKISFEVEPTWKVGVCGPTGCGKSTLALSFFRFVEASGGKISLDGVDISKIGLSDLRSRVTIVPQDPTILSGTLRSTLDVFGQYDDAEIYEALRRVHLIPSNDGSETTVEVDEDGDEINKNVFKSLDTDVAEGGDNFSNGEKQLLCMARAILRKNKIILMDEATSSIDYDTDALINKTVREEFSNSTILTIAHRLRTIIDFDRVLVMDAGKLMEFDEPYTLLQDANSRFSLLCKATGETEYAVLKGLAEEARDRRKSAKTV